MPRKLKIAADTGIDDEMAQLPKGQIRELRRRIRDLDDPIRYVIVSAFTRGFVLYLDVTKDAFVMNDVAGGTLFKRRAHAAAVAATMRDGMQIVKVKVGRHGSVTVLSRIKPRLPQQGVRRSRRGLSAMEWASKPEKLSLPAVSLAKMHAVTEARAKPGARLKAAAKRPRR